MENPQRDFFVYSLEQACEIRLNFGNRVRNLYVLRGPMAGEEKFFHRYTTIPVINNIEQLHRWSSYAKSIGKKLDTVLQFNAGINRSGVQMGLLRYFREFTLDSSNFINLAMIMAHIGCQCTADDHLGRYREKELGNFKYIASFFPEVKKSLVETRGIFNAPEALYDCSRLGIGLFTFEKEQTSDIKTVLNITSTVYHSEKTGEYYINFGRLNGLGSEYAENGYVYLENKIVRIKKVEDSRAILNFRGENLPKEQALLLGYCHGNYIDGFEFSSMNGSIPEELFARIVDRNKNTENVDYKILGNCYGGKPKLFLSSSLGKNTAKFDSSGRLVKLTSIASEKRIVDIDGFCGYGAKKLVKAGVHLITISIGYLSGFSRKFSGTGVEIFVKNKFGEIVSCTLCGVVSMDQICAEISEEDFNKIDIGDTAIVVDETIGITVDRLENLLGGRNEFNLLQYYGKYL
jgi:alanine racemase